MGHRSSDSRDNHENREGQRKESFSVSENSTHPFLQSNDLLYLSVTKPFLSPRGQKLVNFFLTMGDEEPESRFDLGGVLKQIAPKGAEQTLSDLVPTLMGMLSNVNPGSGSETDNPLKINPALINSFMSVLNNNLQSSTTTPPSE